MMRHILQAKVNVLIQNNRIQQQKKEKDKLVSCKIKVKDSFSQYQEPSKKSRVKEGRVVRINDGLEAPEARQTGVIDMQEIYEKRFNEIEMQKYEKIPMEELKKEQQYYYKIIQNIHKKQQEITKQTKQKMTSCVISRNGSLQRDGQSFHYYERQKENKEGRKNEVKRNQKFLRRSRAEWKSQEWQETLHEQQIDAVRLTQLKSEYGHLKEQLRRFSRGSEESCSYESVEIMAEGLEKQANEIRKLIKERKREIIDLNYDLVNNSKVFVKEEHIEGKEEDKEDNLTTIEELQLLIHKQTCKNDERNQYLKDLIQQNQISLEKIKEIGNQRNTLNSKQSQEIIPTNNHPTFKTNLTQAKTPNQSKLKHLTTLEMGGNTNLQLHSNSLFKKKEAVLKSIKREERRWKTIFTQKMKQLVSEYSNLKDINNLGLRIEIELHGRAQQMCQLRGKHSMTEYHD